MDKIVPQPIAAPKSPNLTTWMQSSCPSSRGRVNELDQLAASGELNMALLSIIPIDMILICKRRLKHHYKSYVTSFLKSASASNKKSSAIIFENFSKNSDVVP
jgi:hypothetical protein